ncbi:MAG: ComEA family DNA-binding protein [Clostridia bacterium]|nr:ComEA family DNA-binding protein [Clostridia bacterium]
MPFLSKLAENKTKLILALLCIFTVVSVYFGFRSAITAHDTALLAELTEDTQEENDYIYIHIKGAVKNTGLYRLPRASRVNDAIEAAGGFTDDAASDMVNLAAFLEDGSEIIIPSYSDNINDARININTAGKEQLMKLDGIGEGLAERIIEYREKNGAFLSSEEIKKVSGISDSKYETISDKIKVG